MATPEQWNKVDEWRYRGAPFAPCIIELRDRLVALEQQAQQPASPEPTQRTEPEVQRELLWVDMSIAWRRHHPEGIDLGHAAEIDVVAQWLACNGHHAAADAIRLEARRARGEA